MEFHESQDLWKGILNTQFGGEQRQNDEYNSRQ